jgi:hypothetical protein
MKLNTLRVVQDADGNGASVYLSSEDGSHTELVGYYGSHAKAINAARFYEGANAIEYIVYDGRLTEDVR